MEEARKKHIFGWDILRILLCFEVVCIHFWKPGTSRGGYWFFYNLQSFSVTTFFFLSFYLNKDFFLSIDRQKMKSRMERLLVPYIVWAVVYYLVYWTADLVFDFPDKEYPVSQLFLQLLTGHRLNQAMWFLLDMIIITLVFGLIFLLTKKDIAVFLVALTGILAVFLQYSGITVRAFEDLIYEVKFPLGRLFEMLPYASAGFLLSYEEVFEKRSRIRMVPLLYMACIYLLFRFRLFKNIDGFGWPGIEGIAGAFLLVGLFRLIPDDLVPERGKAAAKKLGRITLGVYCIHNMIGNILEELVGPRIGYDMNSFAGCILIFVLSIVCAALISLLPFPFAKKLVE
ncbi:MAG: acyltransferase [Lachnospiraceae bacterium]|nr:acyltransferase [Lachnospiraceae bacterium]